jgi:hypothetical protein
MNLVPLHTLTAGDKFRMPGRDSVTEIGWQSPKIIDDPAGHMMVEKVEDQ